MSHIHQGPLATYNSLTDKNLVGYFSNNRMRRHLKRAGLVNKRGEIITETQYRIEMARKEHRHHVKDLLAQAIVHKSLDLERHRQMEIRQKLEEIAKIEQVRRVRAECSHKGDEALLPFLTPKASRSPSPRVSPRKKPREMVYMPEESLTNHGQFVNQRYGRENEEVLPYLSPRSNRPTSGPDIPRSRSLQLRPLSAPASSSKARHYKEPILLDEDGQPLTPGEQKEDFVDEEEYGSLRINPDELDTKNLYSLDTHALRKYAMAIAKLEQGEGGISPYLIQEVPSPPRTVRSKSARSRRKRFHKGDRRDSQEKHAPIQGTLMLHRQEPAYMYQVEYQTMCQVTMIYHGPNLVLPRDQLDPCQEVHIDQQHCGGNAIPVFEEKLQPGSTFTFVSRRHHGYPFSLTLYVSGRVDCRISTCCEYRHAVGVRLGGKMGHFSLIEVDGATPCYKCKLTTQASPRSLRRLPPKKIQPEQLREEVYVEHLEQDMPQTLVTRDQLMEGSVVRGQKVEDEYEDDFEEDADDRNKTEEAYADDFEEVDEVEKEIKKVDKTDEDRNTRNILGLGPDEEEPMPRVEWAKTDVAGRSQRPKNKDQDPLQTRKIESYSSEEEDLDGPKKKTIQVEVHRSSGDEPLPQKKDKKGINHKLQRRNLIVNDSESESNYSSSLLSVSSKSSQSSRSRSRSRSRSPSPVWKASPESQEMVPKETVVPVEQSIEVYMPDIETDKSTGKQLGTDAPKITYDAVSKQITEPEFKKSEDPKSSFRQRQTEDDNISKPQESTLSSSTDTLASTTATRSSAGSGSTDGVEQATPVLGNILESRNLETSNDVSKVDGTFITEASKVPEPFEYLRKRDSFPQEAFEQIPEPFLYKKKSELEIKITPPDDSNETESGSYKKGSGSSKSKKELKETPRSETPTKQVTDLTSDMMVTASREGQKIEKQNVQSASEVTSDSTRTVSSSTSGSGSTSESESDSESESESGTLTGTETSDSKETKTESRTETDIENETRTDDKKSAKPLQKRMQEVASEIVDGVEKIPSTQKISQETENGKQDDKESLMTGTETEGTEDSSSDSESSSGSYSESSSESGSGSETVTETKDTAEENGEEKPKASESFQSTDL